MHYTDEWLEYFLSINISGCLCFTFTSSHRAAWTETSKQTAARKKPTASVSLQKGRVCQERNMSLFKKEKKKWLQASVSLQIKRWACLTCVQDLKIKSDGHMLCFTCFSVIKWTFQVVALYWDSAGPVQVISSVTGSYFCSSYIHLSTSQPASTAQISLTYCV